MKWRHYFTKAVKDGHCLLPFSVNLNTYIISSVYIIGTGYNANISQLNTSVALVFSLYCIWQRYV